MPFISEFEMKCLRTKIDSGGYLSTSWTSPSLEGRKERKPMASIVDREMSSWNPRSNFKANDISKLETSN